MTDSTLERDRPARRSGARPAAQRGVALTGTLLVALLIIAIAAGLTALVVADSRVRPTGAARTQAFYAAQAGLEKLTADLGDLFAGTYAPTGSQVLALMTVPPNLGNRWVRPNGSSGYTISFPADSKGNPVTSTATVAVGPFQGMVGLATPYTMTVTARLPDGSDASLTRTLQAVSVPVFQFGIVAEHDLSLFADANFNFGGRVHSNGNIFLAEGAGTTMTLSDRVTSVGEIVRTQLANGNPTVPGYGGVVRAITAPNAYRNLDVAEGSVAAGPGSAPNEPAWTNLSTGAYNHNVMNGRTGAKPLTLAISSLGDRRSI